MSKAKPERILIVMKCTVGGESAFGICDSIARGRKWYFYAYRTSEQAEKIRLCMDTQHKIEVNISRTDLPFQIA